MKTCTDFRKNSRGRPSLSLPCLICGVAYKDHGKAQVKSAAPVAPTPQPAPVISPANPPIPVSNKDVSKVLALFEPDNNNSDW